MKRFLALAIVAVMLFAMTAPALAVEEDGGFMGIDGGVGIMPLGAPILTSTKDVTMTLSNDDANRAHYVFVIYLNSYDNGPNEEPILKHTTLDGSDEEMQQGRKIISRSATYDDWDDPDFGAWAEGDQILYVDVFFDGEVVARVSPVDFSHNSGEGIITKDGTINIEGILVGNPGQRNLTFTGKSPFDTPVPDNATVQFEKVLTTYNSWDHSILDVETNPEGYEFLMSGIADAKGNPVEDDDRVVEDYAIRLYPVDKTTWTFDEFGPEDHAFEKMEVLEDGEVIDTLYQDTYKDYIFTAKGNKMYTIKFYNGIVGGNVHSDFSIEKRFEGEFTGDKVDFDMVIGGKTYSFSLIGDEDGVFEGGYPFSEAELFAIKESGVTEGFIEEKNLDGAWISGVYDDEDNFTIVPKFYFDLEETGSGFYFKFADAEDKLIIYNVPANGSLEVNVDLDQQNYIQNYHNVLKQDYHNVLKQDFHNVLKQDYHNVLKQDYHNVLKQDFHNVLKQDFHNVLKQDYHNVLKQDFHNVLKQDFHNVLKQDFHNVLKQDFHNVYTQGYHDVYKQDFHNVLKQDFHNVLKQDFHNVLKQDFHNVLKQDYHDVYAQDYHNVYKQDYHDEYTQDYYDLYNQNWQRIMEQDWREVYTQDWRNIVAPKYERDGIQQGPFTGIFTESIKKNKNDPPQVAKGTTFEHGFLGNGGNASTWVKIPTSFDFKGEGKKWLILGTSNPNNHREEDNQYGFFVEIVGGNLEISFDNRFIDANMRAEILTDLKDANLGSNVSDNRLFSTGDKFIIPIPTAKAEGGNSSTTAKADAKLVGNGNNAKLEIQVGGGTYGNLAWSNKTTTNYICGDYVVAVTIESNKVAGVKVISGPAPEDDNVTITLPDEIYLHVFVSSIRYYGEYRFTGWQVIDTEELCLDENCDIEGCTGEHIYLERENVGAPRFIERENVGDPYSVDTLYLDPVFDKKVDDGEAKFFEKVDDGEAKFFEKVDDGEAKFFKKELDGTPYPFPSNRVNDSIEDDETPAKYNGPATLTIVNENGNPIFDETIDIINGKYSNIIPDLAPGEYTVSISVDDVVVATANATVVAGETIPANLSGIVKGTTTDTDNPGDDVIIDGKQGDDVINEGDQLDDKTEDGEQLPDVVNDFQLPKKVIRVRGADIKACEHTQCPDCEKDDVFCCSEKAADALNEVVHNNDIPVFSVSDALKKLVCKHTIIGK